MKRLQEVPTTHEESLYYVCCYDMCHNKKSHDGGRHEPKAFKHTYISLDRVELIMWIHIRIEVNSWFFLGLAGFLRRIGSQMHVC